MKSYSYEGVLTILNVDGIFQVSTEQERTIPGNLIQPLLDHFNLHFIGTSVDQAKVRLHVDIHAKEN